mmetsp:Transcript_8763/g.18929  ORF Transcript_8763/g.18929 Transcript_8763/m.18929 type:complete len:95 (-) Transcript_8763:64-348(-)
MTPAPAITTCWTGGEPSKLLSPPSLSRDFIGVDDANLLMVLDPYAIAGPRKADAGRTGEIMSKNKAAKELTCSSEIFLKVEVIVHRLLEGPNSR